MCKVINHHEKILEILRERESLLEKERVREKEKDKDREEREIGRGNLHRN